MEIGESTLKLALDLAERKNVGMLDLEGEEYKQYEGIAKARIVMLKKESECFLNPLDIDDTPAVSFDEKEAEIRKLLDVLGDYGKKYAKETLAELSFLDNTPEWKERVICILEEYLNL